MCIGGYVVDGSLVIETCLLEGKALGRAPERRMITMNDPTIYAAMYPEAYAKARHIGSTVGRRTLGQVQGEVEPALLAIVNALTDASPKEAKELRKEAERLMKGAWKRTYLAGVRAAGMQTIAAHMLTSDDQKFLKSAMAHEMRFLNRFLDAVQAGEGRMPYPRRVQMYVRALESFYDNARVIGMPANVIIRWSGPGDKRTCASCRYLFDHNPYTKATLPTVPRAGTTLCLTNCRDRLTIRRATPARVLSVTRGGKTRKQHIAALERIKRTGKYRGSR